jgi:effector-binding domain-containing protein
VDYEVVKVEMPPHTLAAVRETVKLSDLAEKIAPLLGEVWDFIKASDISMTGHNVIVYSSEGRGADGELSFDALFGVEVRGVFNPTRRVIDAATPGGPTAKTIHMGPYSELPRAHDAVRRWCAANGQRMAGANWEVYGDWSDDPAQLRTDVYYLLESGSRRT